MSLVHWLIRSGYQPLGGAVSVQIFLSYAWADDELPPHMTEGEGFVTCLYRQLSYEFRQRGDPEPIIFKDTRFIEPGDQFDPILKREINRSQIMLIVLSPNWMSRVNCRAELELFKERWKHEGEEGVKHRIIVACKRYVDRAKRPSLLQGQPGYDFFAFEGPKETGQQIDFFSKGAIRSQRFHGTIERLAGFLYRRAQKLDQKAGNDYEAIDDREGEYVRKRAENRRQTKLPKNPGGRKIYLAKPASDMCNAYSRLVEELSHNGYAVIPDPDKDIPYNASATAYVDNALAEADVSIHLLGEEKGYAPEKCEPIARLQLTRAKARLLAAANGHDGDGEPGAGFFRRIIWAPETLEDVAESVDGGGESSGAAKSADPATGRLPLDVLKQFGDFQSNGKFSDKVLGGTISKFVDFLEENLRQPASGGYGGEPTDDDWVYVYHVPADTDYACDLMDAFKQRGIAASLPALEGEPAELERMHKQRLAECSAVVLCWAQATEAWAHARAHELKDLKRLGRQKKFAYRGLLAGPPPGVRKTVFVKYPPANEIDVVLNLSEDPRPLTEAIDKFIHPAPSHAP